MPTDAVSDAEESVRALEPMNLHQLREVWRERFGAPPKLRSPELLRLALAWRLQAQAFGGLDAEVRMRLRRGAGAGDAADRLAPGSRLRREWRGEVHEVVVSPDGGFTHQGRRWSSLSEIAREITGVRWNGPKFFGLRAEAERGKKA